MRRSKVSVCVVTVVLFAFLTGLAGAGAAAQSPSAPPTKAKQETQNPPIEDLHEAGRIHFPVPAPVMMESAVECDQRGRMYVADSDSPQANPVALPIRRLSPDSQGVTTYVMQQPSGYPTWGRLSWSVTPWGTVYVLVKGYQHSPPQKGELPGYFIERFDNDGTVESIITLQQGQQGFVSPVQFAAFAYGGFLITGTIGSGIALSQQRPFTAVYDGSGQFAREVELSDYDTVAAHSEGFGKQGSASQKILKEEWGVAQGMLAAAADGSAYSVRATDPPVLYVISPGGDVTKEVKLQFNSSDLIPVGMNPSAEGVPVIEFGPSPVLNPREFSQHQNELVLVDLETGKVKGVFRQPPGGFLMSSCATPQGEFMFLGRRSDKGTLDLVEFARPALRPPE
ncbi:MAG: hypothetical protein ACRD2B_16350 [Terriglobia bacterium]